MQIKFGHLKHLLVVKKVVKVPLGDCPVAEQDVNEDKETG